MKNRIDMHARAYAAKIADGYPVAIQKNAIHIDLHIAADMNVLAIVDKERRRYPNMLTP